MKKILLLVLLVVVFNFSFGAKNPDWVDNPDGLFVSIKKVGKKDKKNFLKTEIQGELRKNYAHYLAKKEGTIISFEYIDGDWTIKVDSYTKELESTTVRFFEKGDYIFGCLFNAKTNEPIKKE